MAVVSGFSTDVARAPSSSSGQIEILKTGGRQQRLAIDVEFDAQAHVNTEFLEESAVKR